MSCRAISCLVMATSKVIIPLRAFVIVFLSGSTRRSHIQAYKSCTSCAPRPIWLLQVSIYPPNCHPPNKQSSPLLLPYCLTLQVYPNQQHLIHPSPSRPNHKYTLSLSSIPLHSSPHCSRCCSHSRSHCLHCGLRNTSNGSSAADGSASSAGFPTLPARHLPGIALDSRVLQVSCSTA